MIFRRLLSVGGLALACLAPSMKGVSAQEVRIMEGQTQAPLSVPLNRAVVVESEVVFAELSIANPTIADIATLSDRTIYVLGKAPGNTTLTLLGVDGRLIANIDIQVSPHISEIKERLAELLPRENIEVRTANGGIVLSGTVSSAARIAKAMDVAQLYAPDRVLNLMSVGGSQQVMLKVRFAEMSRTVRKELDGALNIRKGDVAPNNYFIDGFLGPADTVTDSPGALQFGLMAGSTSLNPVFNALEDKGLVRTLAEPSLTALSGKSASFLAGGEVPIPVVRGTGEEREVIVEYRNFGIELYFTPTVTDGDIINLKLNAKVSQFSDANSASINGDVVRGFSTRETSTVVELRDGQSFSVAGLLEENFNDSINQVPWLGDIPVLGLLFRSTAFQKDQSELVIIVTAHLVEPTSGDALILPTDRVRPPTENELFLFGRLGVPTESGTVSTRNGPSSEVQRQDFNGSYGYVME